MYALLFMTIASLLLLGIEYIKRTLALQSSTTRRIAHILAGTINIAATFFATPLQIVAVNALFAALLLFTRNSKQLSSIYGVERHSFGDIYFTLGIVFAALILLPEQLTAFRYGIAVMTFADAFAGLVGERFGTHKIAFGSLRKSLEGSLAFFITAILITFYFNPHLSLPLICSALLLTLVEMALTFGLDNLFLPIIAGLLLQSILI